MIGLHGRGMHDFVLRECEVGTRVAAAEDDEACGIGPLLDALYLEWLHGRSCEATRWMLDLLDGDRCELI